MAARLLAHEKRLLTACQLKGTGLQPPKYAKVLYKLVAVSTDGTGAQSLHHESTSYSIGQTYMQLGVAEDEGGWYGFTTKSEAITREAPATRAQAASSEQPVAIAKAKAWNLNVASVPRKHGSKLQYDYFQIVDLLPVSPGDLVQASGSAHGQEAAGALNPDVAAVMAKPATPHDAGEGAAEARGLRVGGDALEQEVQQMEEKLRATMGVTRVSTPAGGATPSGRVEPAAAAAAPPGAATLFVLVGVTHTGQAQSLYCSDALYDVGGTAVYRQVGVSLEEGGLHGFSTLHSCVMKEAAALLQRCQLPVAIAELRAWDLGVKASLHGPIPPGKRVAFGFVRLERLLPVPDSLIQAVPGRLWTGLDGGA